MKKYAAALVFCFAVFCVQTYGQVKAGDPAPEFDAALAEKVGADDYGMKSYVLVILMTGPADAEITDEARRKEIFAGHFSNMGRLAKEGKLPLAGPFGDGKPFRGLFILNVKTIEEAVEIVQTDPAVKAGIFVYELKKWYGTAALMLVNDLHPKIQKTPM